MRVSASAIAMVSFLLCVCFVNTSASQSQADDNTVRELLTRRAIATMELKNAIAHEKRAAVLTSLDNVIEVEGKLFGNADKRSLKRTDLKNRLDSADESSWATFFAYHSNSKLAAHKFSEGEIKESIASAELEVLNAGNFFGTMSNEAHASQQRLLAFRFLLAKTTQANCDSLLEDAEKLRSQISPAKQGDRDSINKLISQLLDQLERFDEAISVLEPIAIREQQQTNKAPWVTTATQLVKLYAKTAKPDKAEQLAREAEKAIESLGKVGDRYRPNLLVGRTLIYRTKSDLPSATREAERAARIGLANFGRHSPYLSAVLVEVKDDLMRSENSDFWETKFGKEKADGV